MLNGIRRGRQSAYDTQNRTDWRDVAAFAIGSLGVIEFTIVGRLFAADVLLAVLCACQLLVRRKPVLTPWPRRILVFGLLWLLGQVATDLFRHSAPEDCARGWANIAFFAVDFLALYLLLTRERLVILYLAGLALGQLVKYFLDPNPETAVDPWKWGFGWPITMICVLIATSIQRRNRLISSGILLIASALNLQFGFRSMALVCFATLCSALLIGQRPASHLRYKFGFSVVALAACGFGFKTLYEHAAMTGALGENAQVKYELQSSGQLGLLVGGRSESLASIQAIEDSPVLGHGSWARDAQYVEVLKNAQAEHGYKLRVSNDDLIPTHSHILGSWVEAGVLGAVFWFLVIVLTLGGLRNLLSYAGSMQVLSLFCGFTLLWDVPFSPFRADRRFSTPVYILLMIVAWTKGSAKRAHAWKPTPAYPARFYAPSCAIGDDCPPRTVQVSS